MKVEKINVVTPVNILFNDHYVTKNITLDFTSVTETADNGEKVVKAGTPVDETGVKATSTAIGILLHDCYESRPSTALIIHGFINEAKAQTNSGVTIDSATKEALPMISFY